MNDKQPQVVNWSKQKPGTIGVTRDGKSKARFLMINGEQTIFDIPDRGITVRNLYGKFNNSDNVLNSDILCPWEECIAEGHNPIQLTNGQVGDGWRLIVSHNERPDARAEIFFPVDEIWVGCKPERYLENYCYRVPIAKFKVPCGPEHFPPGTVVRTAGRQHWQAILWARPSGFGILGPNFIPGEEKYERLMADGIERSIDFGKTWLPCYVEIDTEERR